MGLPTHALIVHVAVILVPLSALALMAVGWRAPWRRVYSLPIAILAVIGGLAAMFAASTGEPLQHSVRQAARTAGASANFGSHPSQGNTASFVAFLFAGAAVGLFAVDRWGDRLKLPKWSSTALYAIGTLLGAVAIVSIAIAGHSGATLVWKNVGTYAATR